MTCTARTAIKRKQPSKPIRTLVTAGWIPARSRVLDYGCGWGKDVEWLKECGYAAEGYDLHPKFGCTGKPQGKFDVVIVSYVVNIIPRIKARKCALRDAWSYVRPGGFLFVTSRTETEVLKCAQKSRWRRDGDGWRTGNKTFQKGHGPEALVKLLPAKLHKVGPSVWVNGTVTACIEFEKMAFTALMVVKEGRRRKQPAHKKATPKAAYGPR